MFAVIVLTEHVSNSVTVIVPVIQLLALIPEHVSNSVIVGVPVMQLLALIPEHVSNSVIVGVPVIQSLAFMIDVLRLSVHACEAHCLYICDGV